MSAADRPNSQASPAFGQRVTRSGPHLSGNTTALASRRLSPAGTRPGRLLSGAVLTAADVPGRQAGSVGVAPDFRGGLASSGLIHIFYGALVLSGLRDWWLRKRTPALEGATA